MSTHLGSTERSLRLANWRWAYGSCMFLTGALSGYTRIRPAFLSPLMSMIEPSLDPSDEWAIKSI